jgi:ketosteroid isomerase-like protein
MLMAPSRAGGYPKEGLMAARTPEQIHRLFEEAFNAGNRDGLMERYEPDAALIAQPGSVAHGSEQARAALQGFLALKGRITLETKLVVTVGELAYLANTWSLSGTGPDGNPVVLGATMAEVARRQADGSWRYVIDNAWGDQAVGGSP